jgi:hypothetical protein
MNPTDDPRTDWNTPKPETLPAPTYWPMFLALGIVFVAYGIIFAWWFVGVGIAIFAVALAGWIGDVRHERERTHGDE